MLPSGAVTFAFTDIEGSTGRWERDRADMEDAVRRHDGILRAAIAGHGGHVFKTIGDAFCSAFSDPAHAVAAMLAAQLALAAEDFAAVDGLRVRAALHTGTADERDGDYFGPSLNKVARMLAIGYGGQTLLTAETADLVANDLPAGASLRNIGTYRLKDITEPQAVHQLLAPGLQAEFPPPRSQGTLPSNLSLIDNAAFHPVPSFDGREDELAALRAALDCDGAIAVAHGMGGIGKSSVAREYGWRNRERYSIVWWLNAQTEDGIIDSLLRLGSTFIHGLEQLSDRRAAAQRVLHSVLGGLERPVLLVFDNLEDEHLMRAWLPGAWTRALATSRDSAWEYRRRDDPIATVVARHRNALPAAIEWPRRPKRERRGRNRERAWRTSARAVACSSGVAQPPHGQRAAATLERIIDHLKRAPHGAEYPRSVFATFSTAIAQAEKHAAGAAAVICLAAFFGPDDIPDELFRQSAELYGGDLRPALPEDVVRDLRAAVAGEFALDEALGTLDRLSLMTFNRKSAAYSLHRLVQLAGRDLAAGHEAAWVDCAVGVVESVFPEQPDGPAKWPHIERLFPHARAALENLPDESASEVAGQLAYRCASYLSKRGEYALAVQMGQRALTILERALGLDHLDVARSLVTLAIVYWDQGRFPESEGLLLRALTIREPALGPDHPIVADTLTSLALTYCELARFPEAERLLLRALAIREASFGPSDATVAPIVNNLALVYEGLGRYADAFTYYARALAIWENALGPQDPRVAEGLTNLAGVHRKRGRAAEAEPLDVRAIAIREAMFGAEHPELAMSLNGLANVYTDQGRFAEAEERHLRALAIREKVFGPDRPDVAQSLHNLAGLYRLQKRHEEAEALLLRAVAIRERALGRDHPEVAESLSLLADVYRAQGRYEKAQPLIDRALAIQEASLGEYHPNTAISFDVLGLLHAPPRALRRIGSVASARPCESREAVRRRPPRRRAQPGQARKRLLPARALRRSSGTPRTCAVDSREGIALGAPVATEHARGARGANGLARLRLARRRLRRARL